MNNRIIKIGLIGLLFVALIAVRYFESFFYDPLQTYFEYNYLHHSLPEINKAKLFLHIFIRYTLNSFISILIIWVAFQKKSYLSFTAYFYTVAFLLLIITFWVTLSTHFKNYYLFGFYVRRFLIHPIFVLLLLPAFYYQRRMSARSK
jgi:exosortase F-associated protein